MNIVFAISEVEGFVKTGGLADVGKALPPALHTLGHRVTLIMPFYREVAQRYPVATSCLTQTLHCGEYRYDFDIRQLDWHGITVYFVDYPAYFDRDGIYSSQYQAFADNGERFAFFCSAVLALLEALAIPADVIHCHDWHTALLPFLLAHHQGEILTHTKSVFTIHNAAFQGVHRIADIPALQQHHAIWSQVHGGYINFLQTGIAFAHKITTVSPHYATELLTDLGSHGLHERLITRQNDLVGILNGCDYSQWDPAHDTFIPYHYDITDLSGKAACKSALQQATGLTPEANVPLLGMVCRLTEQKGFGYLVPILDALMRHRLQLVIVGTGDPSICMDLGEYMQTHPGQFAFINGFDESLAHLVEAGADFFLMPSQFEPCGLNQMYSLAYGTLPIVRAVGGLRDTVIDLDTSPATATGFVFGTPSPEALLHCIRRALLFYHEDAQAFTEMRRRAMDTRFTWEAAAASYSLLFEKLR